MQNRQRHSKVSIRCGRRRNYSRKVRESIEKFPCRIFSNCDLWLSHFTIRSLLVAFFFAPIATRQLHLHTADHSPFEFEVILINKRFFSSCVVIGFVTWNIFSRAFSMEEAKGDVGYIAIVQLPTISWKQKNIQPHKMFLVFFFVHSRIC